MFNLIISSLVGFGFGGFCGHSLSQRGITAENALEKHQKTARGIFLGLVGILTLLIFVDRSNIYYKFPRLVPHLFLLYLQASFDKILLGFGFFICGLLLLLELSGWSSSQRRNQLLIGLSGITFCLCLLLYWFSPIINDLGEFRTSDGVVIQSTTVTCAPASIATLARISGKHPNIQEKDVVKLTQTNRLGTNTMSEIRAMKQLGLNPEYHYNFSVNKLLERHQLALLHVKQRWLSQQFPHAVALLGIDQENQALILGNPLFGIDIKKISDLEGYWFGEVIFVN